jgi:phosphate transport system substrate-binding protein
MFHRIRMRLGLFIFVLVGLGASAPMASAEIVARGSDSTMGAVKALAAAFQKKTGVEIKVEGGGSSKGAKDCLAGAVPLAFMSRGPKEKETKAGLVGVPYAIDGVAVIVHASNPLDSITIEQLRDIYTGKMTKWPDGKPILALNRPESSGTREVFQKKVLGKGVEFTPRAKIKHDAAAKAMVSKAATAIAYTSAGTIKGGKFKVLRVEGVAPTAENIRSKKYPISRTPHFGTKGAATGDLAAFLEFVVSEDGQKVVESVGLVPLK